MPNILYRSCTPNEFEAVLEFWKSSTHAGSTNTAEALHIFMDHDAELFITAWDDTILVGTVLAAWDGWRANFARLAVHDEYRRLGIGRELVTRAEKLLIERGAKRVYAAILKDSPEAFPFWESLGFTPNDVIEPYAKNL